MTLRSCERADAHACIGVCGPVNGAPITPRLPVHLVAAGFDVGGGEFVDARGSIPTTSLPRTALSAWQDEGVWRRDGLDLGRKTREVLHVEGEHGIRAQALGDDEEDPFRGACLDQRVEDVIRDRGLEPLRERHAAGLAPPARALWRPRRAALPERTERQRDRVEGFDADRGVVALVWSCPHHRDPFTGTLSRRSRSRVSLTSAIVFEHSSHRCIPPLASN